MENEEKVTHLLTYSLLTFGFFKVMGRWEEFYHNNNYLIYNI